MSNERTDLAEPPPSRRGMGFGRRLLTCGILLLIPIVGAGILAVRSCYDMLWGFGRSMEVVVAPVLECLDTGDYEGVLEHMGVPSEDREEQAESVRSFGESLRSILGPIRSRKLVGVTRSVEEDGQKAELVYEAEFENDVAQIKVELKERDGTWRVTGIRFASRLIEQNMESLERPGAAQTPGSH